MDLNNINMTKDEKIFYEIVYSIRNMKALTSEMITYIRGIPDNDKMEIIMTYNSMLTWVGTLLEC